VRDRAGRLLRARTELGFELGRDPGAAKLARYLDWETAEVAEVLSLPADADSLGRPLMLPQGDSSLVGDLVRNPHAEDPSDRASLRAELSRLRSEIRRLHSS
jgi:DNA-directed RNA polymerase sigma subunit (sigma70/sigma32)